MNQIIEELKKSLKHKQHEILIMPLNAMREAYAKGVMAGIEVALDKINQYQEKVRCENCKKWHPTLDFSGNGDCFVTRCKNNCCDEWEEKE